MPLVSKIQKDSGCSVGSAGSNETFVVQGCGTLILPREVARARDEDLTPHPGTLHLRPCDEPAGWLAYTVLDVLTSVLFGLLSVTSRALNKCLHPRL